MKNLFYIFLFLCAQFVSSQENDLGKAKIQPNALAEFTQDDRYNRFDNGYYSHANYKKLIVDKKDDIVVLTLVHSSGFSGFTIEIQLDKKLNILKADYGYGTCTSSYTGTSTEIKLLLNQNPFEKLQGLQGQFELKFVRTVSLYADQKGATKKYVFHGKFKSFNTDGAFAISAVGQRKAIKTVRYELNADSYNFTSVDDVYLNPDEKPVFKNLPSLIEAINELNIKKLSKQIFFHVQLEANGEVKKVSIFPYSISKKELETLTTLVTNFPLEVTPARHDGKNVPYSGKVFMNLK